MSAAGALQIKDEGGILTFIFTGRLDPQSTGALWRSAFETLERKKPNRIAIDASGVEYCDGSGVGLLVELRRRQGQDVEVRGLAPQFKALLDLIPFEPAQEEPKKPKAPSLPVEVGRGTAHM